MPIRLTMRQLQMIRALEQTGSVSEAAHKLQVSQSALSHRIREAERLLDTDLYLRQNKRLVATIAGQRVAHAARVILSELEHTEQHIAQLSAGITHQVRIGLQVYASALCLPQLLQIMQQKYPQVSVQLVADTGLDPIAAVRRHDIDMALMSGDIVVKDLDVHPLFEDTLVAVAAASHVWQGQASVTPQDISQQVYIAHHTNPEAGREYESLFRPHDVLPRQVIRAGVTEAVLALVNAGQGVTVMPYWTTQYYAKMYALCVRPIVADQVAINWQLVAGKGFVSAPHMQAVVDSMRSIASAKIRL